MILISILLFFIWLLEPFQFLVVAFKFDTTLNEEYESNASRAVDIFFNSLFSYTLNKFLIVNDKQGFRFGVRDETFSSCMGKNQLFGNLTKFGVHVLFAVELFYKNHFVKSIEPNSEDISMEMDYAFWSDCSISEYGKDYIKRPKTLLEIIK